MFTVHYFTPNFTVIYCKNKKKWCVCVLIFLTSMSPLAGASHIETKYLSTCFLSNKILMQQSLDIYISENWGTSNRNVIWDGCWIGNQFPRHNTCKGQKVDSNSYMMVTEKIAEQRKYTFFTVEIFYCEFHSI